MQLELGTSLAWKLFRHHPVDLLSQSGMVDFECESFTSQAINPKIKAIHWVHPRYSLRHHVSASFYNFYGQLTLWNLWAVNVLSVKSLGSYRLQLCVTHASFQRVLGERFWSVYESYVFVDFQTQKSSKWQQYGNNLNRNGDQWTNNSQKQFPNDMFFAIGCSHMFQL